MLLRFDVFTAVTMKNVVFCDVTLVGLFRTDVSEERVGYIFKVERIRELLIALTARYC
jgi:hypothetical protein